MARFESNPLLSVITACLNSEKYLERAIKSVLAQDYPNIEHIIIDGGSKDGTLDIIRKYENDLGYWVSEPDKSIYDAMNKGIKASKGDILYFLNSDDRLYDKNVVKKVMDFFNKKEVDFIYGDILQCNLNNSDLLLGRYPNNIKKRHFLRGTIGHPTTFFHRDCFIKAGNFDIRYKIMADYEWYLRALFKKGLRAAHTKQIISIFQEGGLSKDTNLFSSEAKYIQKIYFNSYESAIGKITNFLFYGDVFRVIARTIFQKKDYSFLRRWIKKISCSNCQ